jgi:Nif-specific regulatory protein
MSNKIKLENIDISLLTSVSKALSQKDFDKALRDILKIFYSFWGVEYSYIAFYDKSTKTIKIREAFGFNQSVKKILFESGKGIVGNIFKNSIPVVIKDPRHDKAFLNKTKILDKIKDETFVGVPIKSEDETIGVFCLFKNLDRYEELTRVVDIMLIVSAMIGMSYKLFGILQEEKASWEEQRQLLAKEFSDTFSIEGFVGKSEAVITLKDTIQKIAMTDSTVLLLGESGVGKTLIAKAIHALSDRKDKPFISVNCAAIPETLLEAELFGYEKGAFTGAIHSKKGKFELANGGTIFLDEIGELPLQSQSKLLKVIQEKELEKLGAERSIFVNVRVIASTNKDLASMVARGEFREDLYYRLNVIPIRVPALRERKEDIPLLVKHFLDKFNKHYKKHINIEKEAMEALINYNWPGNIRELENLIERLVVINNKDITKEDVLLATKINSNKPQTDIPSIIESTEKEAIKKALEKCGYVKSKAAKMLGLTLRQLDYRIKKYNIPIERL